MTEYAALCVAASCRTPDRGGPRKAIPKSHLCDQCEDKLRANLRDITTAWPDLEAALTRTGAAHTERVGGTRPIGLVLNEAASDARRAATETIAFIARIVVDERPAKPHGTTVPEWAAWVAYAHVPWLARHHDADLVHAITDDVRHTRARVHAAAYPTGVHLAKATLPRCDQHTTDDTGARTPCPGQMTAVVGLDVMPDLICDHDPTHRIGPDIWERQAWKRDARRSMA